MSFSSLHIFACIHREHRGELLWRVFNWVFGGFWAFVYWRIGWVQVLLFIRTWIWRMAMHILSQLGSLSQIRPVVLLGLDFFFGKVWIQVSNDYLFWLSGCRAQWYAIFVARLLLIFRVEWTRWMLRTRWRFFSSNATSPSQEGEQQWMRPQARNENTFLDLSGLSLNSTK